MLPQYCKGRTKNSQRLHLCYEFYQKRLINQWMAFFLLTYSKTPIIRSGHWAVLLVHSMYCRTGIRTGTYNRNFRVLMEKKNLRRTFTSKHCHFTNVYIFFFKALKSATVCQERHHWISYPDPWGSTNGSPFMARIGYEFA